MAGEEAPMTARKSGNTDTKTRNERAAGGHSARNTVKIAAPSPADVTRAIESVAGEIRDAHPNGEVCLVGILSSGEPLARRLAAMIGERAKCGTIDIGLYRDDSHMRLPELIGSELPFDLDDATVILVDDVIASGRTVRAAIDHLMDYGRPSNVQLAVLIDRGGRELPIQPNFVGIRLDAGRPDRVKTLVSADGSQPDTVILTRNQTQVA
jgi:pyrimidine operon attenuation protein/uracil phosphoribosyltransferase